MSEIREHMFTEADRPIQGGQLLLEQYGINWFVKNQNNHQITWGVLGSAVEALTNFMVLYGFGPVLIRIYDGINEVGQGSFLPNQWGVQI